MVNESMVSNFPKELVASLSVCPSACFKGLQTIHSIKLVWLGTLKLSTVTSYITAALKEMRDKKPAL